MEWKIASIFTLDSWEFSDEHRKVERDVNERALGGQKFQLAPIE